MTNYKKLGVIGGVGPAATVQFFQRVVDYTNVTSDQEHLDIDILNRPGIPDRTNYLLSLEDAPSFIPIMNKTAQQLETLGCEILATPCNTAHAALDDIAAGLTQAHFVNMLDETAAFMKQLNVTKCAVLATDGTLQTHAYDQALATYGIQTILPEKEDQKFIMNIIYNQIKAGAAPDTEGFCTLCCKMVNAGCDGLILGCTELSLIPIPIRIHGAPIVDALNVLAWRCVQECNAPTKDLTTIYR